MWMNEFEIDLAVERFQSHPVLGKAARFLAAFRHEVNAHSDGWPYWKAPAQAADKLMTLLNGHRLAGLGAYPRLPAPTGADLTKAIAPIKAFYTRKGYEAGMKFPPLDEPRITEVKIIATKPLAREQADDTKTGLPESHEEQLRSALGHLLQWAVGNRGNRAGNPYGVPEITHALKTLARSNGWSEARVKTSYYDAADEYKGAHELAQRLQGKGRQP